MALLRARLTTALAVTIQLLFLLHACSGAGRGILPGNFTDQLARANGGPVQVRVSTNNVVVNNGLFEVTFEKPGGDISNIRYGGLDNFMMHTGRDRRGYLDLMWNPPGVSAVLDKVNGQKFEIVTQTDDLVELSFVRQWDGSSGSVPLNIDRRCIVKRDVAGVYVYAIYEHLPEWPAFEIAETRLAYKLNEDKFHYMAVSDERQRIMPTRQDHDRGQTLDYKEAVLLTNPSNPDLRGEVSDKYQYSADSENIRVHGWISSNPHVGFWIIRPSDEFRPCGPLKQELTSHVGPTTLSTFMTNHYSGKDIATVFGDGEAWKKVFGPVLVYVNKADTGRSHSALWEDAKRQLSVETQSWPYDFVNSRDYPHSDQRGTVSGQLMVRDRYVNRQDLPANNAYIGLAAPGEAGSWQKETKGYQFWTRADSQGRFEIKNVRPGSYNLYAWVPGVLGDYKYDNVVITVTEGSNQQLGRIVYKPPRQGPTLWEIGVPDRKATEFFVPEVSPEYPNKLYTNLKHDWFRQYGLWRRYTDLYPNEDLVYTVGSSNYAKDWFYAHVSRDIGNGEFAPTTWRVNFDLPEVDRAATYTLQIALASANFARIQVRFNVDPTMGRALFSTKLTGSDNAIARHGDHGMYHFYSVEVPGRVLQRGANTMFLTQAMPGKFTGALYDYIRLEGPSQFR